MIRFKRILKKTAKALLALVLILFVANSLLNYYWGRQIEARLAQIKAAGQPTSFADLQSQAVPEHDNAAPIYKRAFKVMSEPAAARDMETLSLVCTPLKTPSPAEWAEAKSALDRCEGIIALIEKAQSKPECQLMVYPMIKGNLSQESVRQFKTLTQEHIQRWGGLRSAARFLSAKIVISAREGRTQDVVRYTTSSLKINEAFGNQGVLMDYLVNIAIANLTLRNLKLALQYCQPSESQLRKLDSAFASINAAELYKRAIEGERVYFLAGNYEFRKLGVIPFISGDTLAYLSFINNHLKCTRMNYSDALAKGLVGPRAADNLPAYAVFTPITAHVTLKAADARYKCEAEIACARTFLALRAYKGRFGHYPETLSDLRSKLNWKTPGDPFTGKDLMYRRDCSGLVLYSLGKDLKDNGGKIQLPGKDEPGGDIVWTADH